MNKEERKLIGHWLTPSHKHTELSTIEASVTLDGVTLTGSLIRWSPNEWPSVLREIPVSADEMLWTSSKFAQWTLYSFIFCLSLHDKCWTSFTGINDMLIDRGKEELTTDGVFIVPSLSVLSVCPTQAPPCFHINALHLSMYMWM
jgi:hypothetical protein